ncbi:hypothetical protein CAEBREN_07397 [Caenorhabditis brenneri]|uniref:C-type lectin domain-containing protein n=1 Tax=Caenorhabditis brenneri TaxID=135651 RepID=G0N326_CAEBE|nr:hypothetical protein CAEBREN_07397 [Caenorhabditis brenneri]
MDNVVGDRPPSKFSFGYARLHWKCYLVGMSFIVLLIIAFFLILFLAILKHPSTPPPITPTVLPNVASTVTSRMTTATTHTVAPRKTTVTKTTQTLGTRTTTRIRTIPTRTSPTSTKTVPILTKSSPIPTKTLPTSTHTLPISTKTLSSSTGTVPLSTNTLPLSTKTLPFLTETGPTSTVTPVPSTTVTMTPAIATSASTKSEISTIMSTRESTAENPCIYQYNDHCYFPVNTSMKFGDAQKYCSKNCANLPSINSALENQYINTLFKTETVVMLGAVATSKTNIIWTEKMDHGYNNIQNFTKENCVFTTLNSNDGHTGHNNDNTSSLHSVSKESLPDEIQNERTVVEVVTTEGAPDFSPREQQGFFGLLHSTVNNRFKRILLVGVANVMLILSFLLFMLFFVLKIKCAKPEVIFETIQCPTSSVFVSTTVATTKKPTVLLICPDGFTLVGQICWKIFPDYLDRTSAAEMCKTYNESYLFGIYSAEQNQQFIDFMTIKDHPCWLGLMCTNGNQGNCSFDNGLHAPFPYTNFATGSPDASTECLYYDSFHVTETLWISEKCERTLPFVCEFRPKVVTVNAICDHTYHDYCYSVHDTRLSYSDAQDACRNECGNLPSVIDENENKFLISIKDDSEIWLGGTVMSQNSVIWGDGTSMAYTNLTYYDSKQSCIMMESSGSWSTSPCGALYRFVCKVPIDANC